MDLADQLRDLQRLHRERYAEAVDRAATISLGLAIEYARNATLDRHLAQAVGAAGVEVLGTSV